ncbi:endonuclease [Rubrivirga sp. S365]|uniref:endonuclease n=1 Tax=Rubrivirga sp. S365 TaxID=3076080 RepID=UPI0028C59365|nr:endonuclease [Rubrivirga sp. S365]MDT7858149.1 endonuclease [Rubrivirga sp. S365]
MITVSPSVRTAHTLTLLAVLAVPFAGTASAQSSCPGDGWRLRACLRARHAPPALLDADAAARALFETVDVRVRYDSTLVAASLSVEPGPPDATGRRTVSERWEVEAVRYVSGVGGAETTAPDADRARADGWTVHPAEPDAEAPTLHTVGTPLAPSALPAPVDGHLDLHAAWPALGGPVADSARGDLARGALYVRTVYPAHVEAGREARGVEWPASGVAVSEDLATLLDWHDADPPNDAERERHGRAAGVQGNANPFVLDPGLARRAFPPRPSSGAPLSSGALWINEVHATNDGPDSGEGVEVAGPAGTDLLGHRLVFYGGHGEPYDPYDPDVSAAPALSGALPAEGVLGAVWLPARGLWNRCNGVALVDPDGRVSHFLSYGGCRFNAVAGPVRTLAAFDGVDDSAHPDSLLWSQPVRGPGWQPVQEWTTMPAGYSIQLTGAGTGLADFAWGGPHPATPGRLGDYQAGGTARTAVNPVSGWRGGAPAPPGLAAPAHDGGPNTDDEPARPTVGSAAADAAPLDVGPPTPNPVRQGGPLRFAVTAPPGARATAVVLDALGRTVARLDLGADAHLDLDTSALAAGAYTVRVTAGTGGVTAVRRFAVVR